jgi:hypothetical protein
LLDNLVGNAIKFTRSGEIIIEAAATQVEGGPGEAIRLSVSDTGRGFDAAEAERIFLAYHRCEDYPGEEAGNRGLGLYICRSIAQAMSGQISCIAPKGGGAHFEVDLPGAFYGDETHRSAFCSSLLKPLWCQLKLGYALQRSIASFLARLGVRCTDREVEVSDRNLVLRISEATGNGVKSAPALILTPRGNPGPVTGRRVLEAPLLESTLGALLLEIALEWRNLLLRNESPDSIPRRR